MNLWEKFRFILKESKIIGIPINASQVKVLREPQLFYHQLLEKCHTAQKRIVIASLYIGTGPLESQLLTALSERCRKTPSLSVHVLLDGLRGSRGENNSRTMLLPLIKDHNIKVSLYQTPRYRGLLRRLIPNRYNEILGVQHMKFYLFDDDLIITGANLSNDYFTMRQDRYIVVNKCPALGDFVEQLVSRVADFSWQLDRENKLTSSIGGKCHPVNSCYHDFTSNAKRHIVHFYEQFQSKEISSPEVCDTIIYPMLEMGQFGIHQESTTTQKVIEACPVEAHVSLATGYFNITKDLADSIVKRSHAFFHVLMAHPKANGFYNAKGPAGGVTKGYSELAGRFYDLAKMHGQLARVELLEYLRDGWTFHAKGLWLSPHSSANPILTFIGSPNFGERSHHHDIECQFVLASSNENLQKELGEECKSLLQFSLPYTAVERGRIPPLWVKIVLKLFQTYL